MTQSTRRRPMVPATVAALVLLVSAGEGAGRADSPKLREIADGHPALARASSALLRSGRDIDGNVPAARAFRARAAHAMRGDRLECVVGVDGSPAAVAAELAAHGATVTHTYDLGTLRGFVVEIDSFDVVRAACALPAVRGIRESPPWRLATGSVTGQGVATLGADEVHSRIGLDGTGIRVGVLSDTVNRVIGGTITGGFLQGSASQVTGDLPPMVRVVDPGPTSGTDEGAAMAEIVYDIAPGADISFASASSGYFEFAQNITALATDPGLECDVIVDDVIYLAEPVYQDGPIAVAIDQAVAADVVYFSSAGNNADHAHERTFFDVDPAQDDTAYPPTEDDFHDFGRASGQASEPYLVVNLAPGDEITAVLQWDEPFDGVLAEGSGAEADLDLYILDDPTPPVRRPDIVAVSSDFQGTPGSPAGEPIEIAGYVNTSTQTQRLYLAVDHYAGREPVEIFLIVYGDGTFEDSGFLGDRAIYGHAAAGGANAVAAVFYAEADSGGTLLSPTDRIDAESYSSLGGELPFRFDPAGNRLATVELRTKPEIAAPDGANTTFFYADSAFDADTHPNFFGTSAAAPHAAGVAALLLQPRPDLTPGDVRTILRRTAVDIETPGPDAWSGAGLVRAPLAVQTTATYGSVVLSVE